MSVGAIRRVRGFTLVELVVTLAILAILLAAAAPSFADFFDRYRLRGAIDDVISVIANARTSSVKSNRDVSIAFGGTAANWCVGANAALAPTGGAEALGANACDCAVTTECLVEGERLAVNQGKHGDIVIAPAGANFIFNSKLGTAVTGGAITSPANVTFTSATGKYDLRLDVTALGQSRMCVPAGKPVIAGVTSC